MCRIQTNIQKSVAFIYTNNDTAEKEIMTIPFTIVLKKNT
jgi:hypothetical protein